MFNAEFRAAWLEHLAGWRSVAKESIRAVVADHAAGKINGDIARQDIWSIVEQVKVGSSPESMLRHSGMTQKEYDSLPDSIKDPRKL